MRLWITLSLAAVAGLTPVMADPIGFIVTNLASDVPGLANSTDPDLVNAWGMASSAGSPVWLGANGTGKSVLYNGNTGAKLGLVVTIPGDGSVTGVVFNSDAASFNGDAFLFASEDGTLSGWRGGLGTTAETLQLGSAANVYKGVAEATVSGSTYAYLANFRAGTIDVVKGNAADPSLPGTFTDPTLPAGYAPFDIQNLGGILYVTYAVQDPAKHDDVPGTGHGFVDTFTLNGAFIKRLVDLGPSDVLDSPWGLALAPTGFGDVGGDLLVGNFGNGMINAFNPSTGAFVETLQDTGGVPIVIDGLWGLRFGNGGNAGPTSTLYFTAGPDGESHGLFGDIVSTPEPGTWVLAAIALLPLLARKRWAKAK
jgi:uncharacterized protein (TIGR03118 family)